MELERDTTAQCLLRETYYFSIYPHRCIFHFLWLSGNISSFISFHLHISDMVYRISVIMSDAVAWTKNEIYCREWWRTLFKLARDFSRASLLDFFFKCAAVSLGKCDRTFRGETLFPFYGVAFAFDGRSTVWLCLKLLKYAIYAHTQIHRSESLRWSENGLSLYYHAINWSHAFSRKLIFLFRELYFYPGRNAVGNWENYHSSITYVPCLLVYDCSRLTIEMRLNTSLRVYSFLSEL